MNLRCANIHTFLIFLYCFISLSYPSILTEKFLTDPKHPLFGNHWHWPSVPGKQIDRSWFPDSLKQVWNNCGGCQQFGYTFYLQIAYSGPHIITEHTTSPDPWSSGEMNQGETGLKSNLSCTQCEHWLSHWQLEGAVPEINSWLWNQETDGRGCCELATSIKSLLLRLFFICPALILQTAAAESERVAVTTDSPLPPLCTSCCHVWVLTRGWNKQEQPSCRASAHAALSIAAVSSLCVCVCVCVCVLTPCSDPAARDMRHPIIPCYNPWRVSMTTIWGRSRGRLKQLWDWKWHEQCGPPLTWKLKGVCESERESVCVCVWETLWLSVLLLKSTLHEELTCFQ